MRDAPGPRPGEKYYHEMEGYNGRLDAIQAGILRVKLKCLAGWNARRREAATRYRGLLMEAGMGEWVPYEPDCSKAVYHLYVIRSRDRAGLMRHLADANVGAGIHYPVPLHLQSAYESLGYSSGDFPITEAAASEVVSLPMYPQLAAEQQERVVNEIQRFSPSPQAALRPGTSGLPPQGLARTSPIMRSNLLRRVPRCPLKDLTASRLLEAMVAGQ